MSNFVEGLHIFAERIGVPLEGNLSEVREYAAARMLHLSLIVGEPGYAEALEVEALNVALMAAGSAVDSADEVDSMIIAFVFHALVMGSR